MAFIICLDQYSGGQHRLNQAWFEQQLAINRNPHVFVFGHEPAFEANYRITLPFIQRNGTFSGCYRRAGARIYFSGHDHFYNRTTIPDNQGNQIWQILQDRRSPLKELSEMYRKDKRVTWDIS
jgi:hypothetical protein